MVLLVGDWIIDLSRDSRPREVVAEVSTRCNLVCVHCFRYSSKSLELADMPLEDFRKIVDNSFESGVKRIVLTGWGEPTVNPNIVDMISYAKKRGLYTILNTNGVMLGELIDDILRLGLDELYVSIDAVDLQLYEKIRRLGDLSAVSKSLAKLSEIKTRSFLRKPIVKSIFTITKLNVDQIPRLLDFAVEIGIQEIYLSYYIHYPGGMAGADCLSDQECQSKLRKYMADIGMRAINMPIKIWAPNTGSYTSRLCPFAANRALYVRVDGVVTPCLYLAHSWRTYVDGVPREIKEVIIGNALKERLTNIWTRHTLTYFKLFFNYMPSCLDCELKNWCSYTLSAESDCWGNTPNCAHCPYHYRLSYCPI